MPRLMPAERRLIFLKVVFAGVSSIAAIFLNLYLFGLGGFRTVAAFYTADYAVLTAGFVGAGMLMRRVRTNRLMAIGLAVSALMFMYLLSIGAEARHYVLLLGTMQGIGEGLFWPALNLSEYRVTSEKTRALYLGVLSSRSQMASMVGPPLAALALAATHMVGWQSSGYSVLFAALLVGFCLCAVAALRCPAGQRIVFSPSQIGKGLTNPAWRLTLGQWVLRGLWISALPVFAIPLLYSAIHHATTVTIVIAAASLVSAVSARLAGRILHVRHSAFVLGAIAVPFGLMGFAMQSGWFGVCCFIVVISGCDPFSSITTSRHTFTAMTHMSDDPSHGYHLLVENEIAINSGRLIGFVLILVATGSAAADERVRTAILCASMLPLAVGVLQHRLHRYIVTNPLRVPAEA